jgi:trehalose synthase
LVRTAISEVETAVRSPQLFESVLDPEGYLAFEDSLEGARRRFEAQTIWQVNSTPQGGGVAEMLGSLVPYIRGAGIDSRWLVIPGDDEFFTITKRIHNFLHGSPGDGGPLGDRERWAYEAMLGETSPELAGLVRPGDVIFFNDPQTAGLIPAAKRAGARIVWRCHVGCDAPNGYARAVWRFLGPYVEDADAIVFSRRPHVWEGLEGRQVAVIPPSIDAFSPKNQQLSPEGVASILGAAGLFEGAGSSAPPAFIKSDATSATVGQKASFVAGGPLPANAAVVTQISRWDRLKDPVGVLVGFALEVAPRTNAHLLLAGPSVDGVIDDPEGESILEEVVAAHRRLPPYIRERSHIAVLPVEDDEENSAIVNALQRRAGVIVQKSLAEGFGLTVAEAMWKKRPVVASQVGGIQDQIEDGISGRLIHPQDIEGFGAAVTSLLVHDEFAREIGEAAHRRVLDRFLDSRHLILLLELASDLEQ